MEVYNSETPLILHVDLNSAFATIEQQSRPLLRGRPVAVINRRTENTSIVTASYEAKAYGVKVGMKLIEAKKLIPNLVAIESDPAKYRFVYHKLLAIMNYYSPNVVMKSIDEGNIDLHNMAINRPPVEIGYEIKQRLRDEIGSAMRCNIGIGTNRFLAKTAAGLHKPDGLDVIDSTNLRETYKNLKLTDLTGIAGQMENRLNAVGIYKPIEFLDADVVTLQKIVFKSIVGQQWYQRLRGYEVDDSVSTTKTVGRQYVLEDFNLSRDKIKARLHNLCESIGFRLRLQNKVARGIYVYVKTLDKKYWHACKMCQMPFFSDQTINFLAQELFARAPDIIKEIGLRCYELSNNDDQQLSIFCDDMMRERQLVNVIDQINYRFGDRTVHSAATMNTEQNVKQKIPFGSTSYL